MRAHADTDEVIAIRAALEAAGIPKPMGSGARHTATWVAVALAEITRLRAELEGHAAREAELLRQAAEQTAAAERETAGRVLASERVKARGSAAGCPRPDKAAYDISNEHEQRLAERRRSRGIDLYMCVCGWSHLGHPPAVEVPDAPALPDDPMLWARDRRKVVLFTGGGGVQAEGQVVAYHHDPTVQIRTVDGRVIAWRADLARPVAS